jgi:hypothetical protein
MSDGGILPSLPLIRRVAASALAMAAGWGALAEIASPFS